MGGAGIREAGVRQTTFSAFVPEVLPSQAPADAQPLPSLLAPGCSSEWIHTERSPSIYNSCPLVNFLLLLFATPSFHVPDSCPVFIF